MKEESEELSPELEAFFTAYVECALWSSTDNVDESGGAPLDDNFGEEDLSEDSRREMLEDCRNFLEANAVAIGTKYEQAGHDFWLTRNGHGAGFWDRGDDEYPGDKHELSKASKAFGAADLIVGEDGKIHC